MFLTKQQQYIIMLRKMFEFEDYCPSIDIHMHPKNPSKSMNEKKAMEVCQKYTNNCKVHHEGDLSWVKGTLAEKTAMYVYFKNHKER